MGIKEYVYLRDTMLDVKALTDGRREIEERIRKLKNKNENLSNDLKMEKSELKAVENKYNSMDTKALLNIYNEEIEYIRKRLDRNEKGPIFAICSAICGGVIMMAIPDTVMTATNWLGNVACMLVGSLCFILPAYFWSWIIPTRPFLFGEGRGKMEESDYTDKLLDLQEKIKAIRAAPDKIKSMKTSISNTRRSMSQRSKRVEHMEQNIEEIGLEIYSLMDSVAHLIPYADQIE